MSASVYAPHPLAKRHVRAKQSARRQWRYKSDAVETARAAALIAARS